MKFNKSETALLANIDRRGQYTVECGLDRGRGGTGALRSYGRRERNAAHSLIAKGVIECANVLHSNDWTGRGYMAPSTELTVVRVATK